MKKIAIFASGSGSNAQKIIEYFNEKPEIGKVEIIFSNKKDAYVLERAKSFNIPSCIFNREEFYHTERVQNILNKHNIDLIVLAGFLWLVPQNVLQHYPKQIINIHPALLPKYGGKGMFGANVHEAVIKNKDEYSGITIHYVNERYDEGDIISQAKCKVDANDTAESLANKIHALEYEYYPRAIEEILVRF